MKKSLFAAAALSLALIPYSASAQQSNPPSDPQSVQQPASTTAQPAEANPTPSTPSQANQSERRTDTSDPNANAAPGTNVNREAVGTAGQASAQDPDAAATRRSNESLPATGSPIPLMLFGAFSAFAAAGGLRIARR